MSAPRTPADARSLDLDALAAELRRVELALIDHRYGGEPLTTAWFITYTLAALDIGHVIAQRARIGRWVHAREALSAGATVERVATAMGLDPDELRTGLVEWADGQREFGLITDAEHVEVLALVSDGTTLLPCGCPEPIVADEGHQPGCDADAHGEVNRS